jgi:hypothetical protein
MTRRGSGLTVDMLGRRMGNTVGRLERSLVTASNTLSTVSVALAMRDLGDRLDVDHFERRVGGAFGRRPRCGVGRIAMGESVPSTSVA